MKVKMLKTMAGPEMEARTKGMVVEVTAKEAKSLLEGRIAELVDPNGDAETAVDLPPEEKQDRRPKAKPRKPARRGGK